MEHYYIRNLKVILARLGNSSGDVSDGGRSEVAGDATIHHRALPVLGFVGVCSRNYVAHWNGMIRKARNRVRFHVWSSSYRIIKRLNSPSLLIILAWAWISCDNCTHHTSLPLSRIAVFASHLLNFPQQDTSKSCPTWKRGSSGPRGSHRNIQKR